MLFYRPGRVEGVLRSRDRRIGLRSGSDRIVSVPEMGSPQGALYPKIAVLQAFVKPERRVSRFCGFASGRPIVF